MKKRNLTEERLMSLGFKKVFVSPEEAGDDRGYHYFVYELFNGECLISQADNERKDEYYDIQFFHMIDAGYFTNEEDIVNLISAIEIIKNCSKQ